MGTVWRGYDEKLRRDVAVKTLRADQMDFETRARLLAEARLLSQLEHPNICRLYDYVEGEESDYLVLELIQGRTLNEAVEDGLSESDKLHIAEETVRALVVAHARGIVHRDLKPSNVMLAEGDDVTVKVLDFGLARSLEGPEEPDDGSVRLAPAVGTLTGFLLSETGRVSGTPAYMSPEQARGEGSTAASDMYSFGLLLQRLFTGRRPYPTDISLDVLLVKASQGDVLPADGVRHDVRALLKRLLALAPEERPAASETVALLQAIRDRPKRRRRWLSVAAVLALFVAGVFKYAYDQQQGRIREAEARQEAEQTTAFLVNLFHGANPLVTGVKEPTVRSILDQGRDRLAEELADQPRVRRALLNTLGNVYDSLGHHEEAEGLMKEALEVTEATFGPESLEAAQTLHILAITVHRQARFDDAEQLYLRALEIHEVLPDKDSPEMAAVLYNLANIYDELGDLDRAGPLYQQALDILEGDEEQEETLAILLLDMAIYYRNLGEVDQAENLLLRTLEIRERSESPVSIAEVLNSLALLYTNRGELARAELLFQRALEIGEPVLGVENHLMLTIRHNFGMLLLRSGELESAASMLEDAIEVRRQHQIRKDSIAASSHILAQVYTEQERYDEAEQLLGEALAVWKEMIGELHPRTGRMLVALAAVRRARGASQEAEELLEQALGIFAETLGEQHKYLAEARQALADLRGDAEPVSDPEPSPTTTQTP